MLFICFHCRNQYNFKKIGFLFSLQISVSTACYFGLFFLTTVQPVFEITNKPRFSRASLYRVVAFIFSSVGDRDDAYIIINLSRRHFGVPWTYYYTTYTAVSVIWWGGGAFATVYIVLYSIGCSCLKVGTSSNYKYIFFRHFIVR